MNGIRKFLIGCFVAATVVGFGYGTLLVANSMKPELAGALITAATTVIITVITISFGRYFEKKRELEVLHREKKIPIYGEFLEGVFTVFYGGKSSKQVDMVSLLRKWQTRIVLWGGADVVNAYLKWKDILTTKEPNAETLRVTDALILAIRRELGHDDAEMAEDLLPRFILRHYEIYKKAAESDPNVKLAALEELESQRLES